MKHPEENSLLNELLTGEEVAQFREASLQHGLTVLRRRKRRARVFQCGALVALPFIALALVFSLRQAPEATMAKATPQHSTPATAPQANPEPPPVEVIDDAELFALFPNRSLALIGPPGKQQLVFLDDLVSN